MPSQYTNSIDINVFSLTDKLNSDAERKATIDISVGTSDFVAQIQELRIKVIHVRVELIERELCSENYRGEER